jgi:hypothetical protein
MKNILYHPILTWSMLIVIMGVLVGCTVGHAQSPANLVTFIPIVSKPPRPINFSVEVYSLLNKKVLSAAVNAYPNLIRRNGLFWSDVQPNTANEWLWDNPNVVRLQYDLSHASSNGMDVMLIVRSTPGWAQQFSGYSCGPIKPEKLGDFANFMAEVVKRYSVQPYNVKYYEIWNEPDIDHILIPENKPYGCWGNINDYYNGGDVYASMLKQVYPAMKAVNPKINIVIGGLLLDCDPTNPGTEGYCPSEERAIAPRFFEGILKAGGGDYFDIVGFHGYPTYYGHSPIMSELSFPTWKAQGGVVQGKINYLREIMSQYDISKPIIHSEGALLFSNGDAFEEAKADYVPWLYARNMSEGIRATTWFTLSGPGWRGSGLLDQNQDPLPAYWALKFMIQELTDATFISKTEDPNTPGVVEFIFSRMNKSIHIYFSIDGDPHDITTPIGWTALYDVYGNPLTNPGDTLTILHPVYLESGQ